MAPYPVAVSLTGWNATAGATIGTGAGGVELHAANKANGNKINARLVTAPPWRQWLQNLGYQHDSLFQTARGPILDSGTEEGAWIVVVWHALTQDQTPRSSPVEKAMEIRAQFNFNHCFVVPVRHGRDADNFRASHIGIHVNTEAITLHGHG